MVTICGNIWRRQGHGARRAWAWSRHTRRSAGHRADRSWRGRRERGRTAEVWLGLMRRTDRPAASKARRTPRSVAAARLEPNGGEEQSAQPPDQRAPACLVVGDREACALRQAATRQAGPATRQFPPKHCSIILLVPSLLIAGSGPGNCAGIEETTGAPSSIRGLITEAATGFQSRRGRCGEPTPVTPHYAPFATYKTAGVYCDAGAVASCSHVFAQQPTRAVIGYLSARSADTDKPMLAALREGLEQTGYVEGKNLRIEFRWGEGQYEHLPPMAVDLVRQQVGVIITGGGEIAALAAKSATNSIPVVFNVGGDTSLGIGFKSNRPGGNVTGVSSFLLILGEKQLDVLRQVVPSANVIGILSNPKDPGFESARQRYSNRSRFGWPAPSHAGSQH